MEKKKNLKNRVLSYLNQSNQSNKTRILVNKITDLRYIVVNSEQDALLLENNRKANYKDYIQSLVNPDCTAALSRIYPRIDLTVINNVIDSEPLSDIRKDFYKVMLRARFERILMSAYHSIYSQTSFFS